VANREKLQTLESLNFIGKESFQKGKWERQGPKKGFSFLGILSFYT